MDWSYSREFRVPLYKYSISSITTKDQLKTEELVSDTYYKHRDDFQDKYLKLQKFIHTIFAKSNLYELPNSYESLDASQTWLIYWNIHSLRLLSFHIPEEMKPKIVADINSCQNDGIGGKGGFGGGPHQVSHMATTFAAVMALVDLESTDGLASIDRERLYQWLMDCRLENGAFVMHEGGEVDIRGCYCAISVAMITGIATSELFSGTADWIVSCQTYEGGFGGAPGLEAHGGYTYCALAALLLLGATDRADLERLLRWAVSRQLPSEGGFQGRTNKLVDSCYTFWVGALFPLIREALKSVPSVVNRDCLMFDVGALEHYVLGCCQRLSEPFRNPNGGGMIDKPGKNADPYHTCYALSGLSVAQEYEQSFGRFCVGSDFGNELESIDPVFNVTRNALEFARRFFENK